MPIFNSISGQTPVIDVFDWYQSDIRKAYKDIK